MRGLYNIVTRMWATLNFIPILLLSTCCDFGQDAQTPCVFSVRSGSIK